MKDTVRKTKKYSTQSFAQSIANMYLDHAEPLLFGDIKDCDALMESIACFDAEKLIFMGTFLTPNKIEEFHSLVIKKSKDIHAEMRGA